MAVNIQVNPLAGVLSISSHYGMRTLNGEKNNHRGTDFRAPAGTPIYAVDDGVVDLIKYDDDGYGHYLVLKHEDYYTLYAHMRVSPSKYVATGQTVEAGQQIGEVGTTGQSTGNHLHFEIRIGSSSVWNSATVNPMSYLSTESTTESSYQEADTPSSGELFSSVPTPSELGYSVYTNESSSGIYPETVANLTHQPMMPFVEIYVGETKLTLLPPRYLQSFEFNKLTVNRGNDFTLVIFDDNWEEIEYLFSQNMTDIRFRYGYAGGKQSHTYIARVTDYTIDFTSTGTILAIKGMTEGTLQNLTNITLNTGTINPTEAAKAIARAAGWTVLDENFHPSHDIEFDDRESITIKNERPATYIINKLAPLAIRAEDGKGGYRFYLDETQDPPVAYFRPMDLHPDAQRTYIYIKGVDSPVLDLQLAIEGVFGGSATANYVGTKIVSTFYDPTTKEEISLSKNVDDTRIEVDGEYSHTDANQYEATVDSGGSSYAEMNARLNYRLSFGGPGVVQYKGYMTIVGDPSIEHITDADNDTIRVLIITDRGDLHHTSGLYQITGISDSINGGVMRTTLQIVKNADLQDGIEIANYRVLLDY